MSAITELAAAIDHHASRPFLIDPAGGRELTHGESRERALALASALRELGLDRGDRLAVSLPNSVELALVYQAALLSGIVIVPLGQASGGASFATSCLRSRPSLALTGSASQALAAVADELDVMTRSIDVADGAGELDPWSLASADLSPFEGMDDGDLIAVHFTSGSTGTPRGVAHRLGDFSRNAVRYATANELDESHRFHHSLPMTYMAGYYNLILLPLQIGASVVLDRAFDVQSVLRYWDVPREHGVDVLWLVPTIMAMLLKVDRTGAGRTFCRERVRHVASGTAPLDPDLREQFEREYGVAVHDSYGLSETLLLTSSTAARPARPSGVGGRFLGWSSASRERPAPLGRSWPDPGTRCSAIWRGGTSPVGRRCATR